MKYAYYEEGYKQIFTLAELRTMWDTEILQSNFGDFDSWLEEMMGMQILNPVA